MWRTIGLLLPALIPSWRFFKSIEPSPRIQWRWDAPGGDHDWREFRPRPQSVSVLQMIKRLFWNPDWSDYLYVVSCAERIQQDPTAHSIEEIRRAICQDLFAERGCAEKPAVSHRVV